MCNYNDSLGRRRIRSFDDAAYYKRKYSILLLSSSYRSTVFTVI